MRFARTGLSRVTRALEAVDLSVVCLAREWGGSHGGPLPKLIEPIREPGPSVTKVREVAELEPVQAGSERNMSHMDGVGDIELALQPVITGDELLDVPVPERRVAQPFRTAHGLPAKVNAGIGKALSQGLLTQCAPPGFAMGGISLRPSCSVSR